MCAKANISEYWIVDIKQKQLLVFREPQGDIYQTKQMLGANDAIAPIAFPDVVIHLSNLLD